MKSDAEAKLVRATSISGLTANILNTVGAGAFPFPGILGVYSWGGLLVCPLAMAFYDFVRPCPTARDRNNSMMTSKARRQPEALGRGSRGRYFPRKSYLTGARYFGAMLTQRKDLEKVDTLVLGCSSLCSDLRSLS